jgi:NhaA family Na+:H+ antiporter
VFGAAALLVRAGIARAPDGVGDDVLVGVALLCGIGFTMSLFIGTLAFPDAMHAAALRLGVIGGSLLSGAFGAAWLAWRLPRVPAAPYPRSGLPEIAARAGQSAKRVEGSRTNPG